MSSPGISPRIFGTDGIRGRAGEGWLTEQNVERLGAAVGALIAVTPERFGAAPGTTPRLVLARDTRPSGPALAAALERGLQAAGCEAIDLGVAPTPALAAAIAPHGALAGAMISASHNPAADNGVKLFSAGAQKLPAAVELELEAYLTGQLPLPPPAPAPGAVRRLETEAVRGLYLAHLLAHLEAVQGLLPELTGRRLVVDCAQGAASAFAPAILRELGAEVTARAADGEGALINEGCGALHPEALAAAVVNEGAHAGLAFDGDADRVILVDETGAVRDGDHILLVLGVSLDRRGALAHHTVVGTVMSNLGLERALSRHRIELRRTPVGDRHVALAMTEHGLDLGGEQAGHVIVRGPGPLTGDGLLVGLHVLAVLARTGARLSQLCAELEPCPQALLNVPVASKPPLAELAGVQHEIALVEAELGDHGRVLLRYSGTEDRCRVMVEAEPGLAVAVLAERIASAVRKAIG